MQWTITLKRTRCFFKKIILINLANRIICRRTEHIIRSYLFINKNIFPKKASDTFIILGFFQKLKFKGLYFQNDSMRCSVDLFPSKITITGENYKNTHLKSLKIVLSSYSKWRNIFSRKSTKFQYEQQESVTLELQPALSLSPTPAQLDGSSNPSNLSREIGLPFSLVPSQGILYIIRRCHQHLSSTPSLSCIGKIPGECGQEVEVSLPLPSSYSYDGGSTTGTADWESWAPNCPCLSLLERWRFPHQKRQNKHTWGYHPYPDVCKAVKSHYQLQLQSSGSEILPSGRWSIRAKSSKALSKGTNFISTVIRINKLKGRSTETI